MTHCAKVSADSWIFQLNQLGGGSDPRQGDPGQSYYCQLEAKSTNILLDHLGTYVFTGEYYSHLSVKQVQPAIFAPVLYIALWYSLRQYCLEDICSVEGDCGTRADPRQLPHEEPKPLLFRDSYYNLHFSLQDILHSL